MIGLSAAAGSAADRLRHPTERWDRVIFATQVALAASLAMIVAFLIDLPKTYWALLTVPMVVRQQSGMTVWRSVARLAGTLLGAFVVLFFIDAFAGNGHLMILCLALWILGCGFLARFEIGADAYAYGTAGVTALVIAIDAGPYAGQAFGYALSRFTETLVAAAAGIAVLLTLLPRSIGSQLASHVAEAREAVLKRVERSVGVDAEETAADRRAVANALAVLSIDLRARELERSHDRPGVGRLRAASSRLNHLLAAADGLGFAIIRAQRLSGPGGEAAEMRRRLTELLMAIDPESSTAGAALADAARLREFAGGIDRMKALSDLIEAEDDAAHSDAAVLYRLRELAMAMARFLEADAAVLDPSRPEIPVAAFRPRYRDASAALQRGLRPAIAFCVVAYFWLESGWQAGGILALITGTLSLLLPMIEPRAQQVAGGIRMCMGFFCGGMLALGFTAIMPWTHGIEGFLLFFAPTMFIAFYYGTGPHLPVAIGTTIMLAIAFQPANEQVYDLARLTSVFAALMVMPAVYIASVTVLFPEDRRWLRRHLERGTTDLLARAGSQRERNPDAFLAQIIDLLTDYGGDLDPEDPSDGRLLTRARAAAHAGEEFYELHRIGRSGRLDPVLLREIPALVEAVRAAARLTIDEKPDHLLARLDAIIEVARTRLSLLEPKSLARVETLRFTVAAELLRMLVFERRLARPGAAETAR